MFSLVLWMVTEFDNTSLDLQAEPSPQNWSNLSFVLHVLLPLAGVLVLFKQKHIFSKLLLQLDRNCVSVFCPSLSHREKLLKWAGSRLPETWSSQSRTLAGGVAELWSDGSLLCTLINSAIPGACPNPHRHWKKPPLHAQAIAYKYLGVIPIFTEQELNDSLSVTLERNFLRYLNELQQAIIKLSERNDTLKTVSIHYIVRGMGLYSGEQHRKTVFYVYPDSNTTGQNSNIILHIRGPYATYGKAIIPKFHNDLFSTPEINVTSDILTTKKLLKGQVTKPKNSFMRNFSLPFMQYHKKHLGDNIVIDVTMEEERAKVTYIPKNYGMYEIIMVSNGELIRGCPFNVHILSNVSGIEDSFDNEGKIEDIPGLRRRKVLSKMIDFVDEQLQMADVLKRYQKKEELLETVEDKQIKIKKEIDKSQREHILKKSTDENDIHILEGRIISENHNSDIQSNVANGGCLGSDHILKENDQTQDNIRKANDYADNEVVNNFGAEGFQVVSTNKSTDKKVLDDLERKKQIYRIACNTNNDESDLYSGSRKMEVNKLKIPEKFCELENENDRLNAKYYKNVINTSNKSAPRTNCNGFHRYIDDRSKQVKNDDNNNNVPSINYREAKENLVTNLEQRFQQTKVIPRRFVQSQEHLQTTKPHLPITSPICPNHIVPEVENEYKKMSVAEKRKIFATTRQASRSTSSNSSFSEAENAEGSHFTKFEGLSVMNYLGSLKQAESEKTREVYPLCGTMSLPNISSMENPIFRNTVKERANFWEKVSSSSSSLSINSEISLKKRNLSEIERSKLIWKKPEENTNIVEEENLNQRSEISKSVDDIVSIGNVIPHELPKKYKSMDHSLDKCTVLSVEERKKMLLKKNYEKEIPKKPARIPTKHDNIKEDGRKIVTRNEDQDVAIFSSIADRIKKYDSACNLLNNKIEEESTSELTTDDNTVENISKDSPNYNEARTVSKAGNLEKPQDVPLEILRIKSHFKRAIKYFKNLERKSANKSKIEVLKDCRRHSLDMPVNKHRGLKKGGSLNLPNVRQRFSVNNLYEDVFGGNTGSFKGAINRSALVEALATFARRDSSNFGSDEEGIMYNMFQNKSRVKKRRSIRSIFDIYY